MRLLNTDAATDYLSLKLNTDGASEVLSLRYLVEEGRAVQHYWRGIGELFYAPYTLHIKADLLRFYPQISMVYGFDISQWPLKLIVPLVRTLAYAGGAVSKWLENEYWKKKNDNELGELQEDGTYRKKNADGTVTDSELKTFTNGPKYSGAQMAELAAQLAALEE